MFRKHVTKELSAYCHNELSTDDSRRVATHVLACQRCRRDLEEIKLGIRLAEQLPQASAPASMWSEIEALLGEPERAAASGSKPLWRMLPVNISWPAAAVMSAVLLLALGIGAAWYYIQGSRGSWEVARLDGAPTIGSDRISETGKLAVGEWLETDSNSRAKINVSRIGQVEIEPNTRVRLLETRPTEHRLALARGRMHALIWAPPRLFFVETPSAVAADLGCAYTLEVDDAGASLLHVTSGWVALDLHGRESIVPAGAFCATRPGIGPGTPYFEDASEVFRTALAKIDFEKNTPEAQAAALGVVLAESRKRDGLTLWHLLPRVNDAQRERVFDRLMELVPPPAGITREGILRLDEQMLDLWKEELELNWFAQDSIWRKAWRRLWN